ncbi:MAG: VWA domain-containing protein [Syntrophomonadaceae bacterium]|nr:VWA domain-containing protein [Syntrophomonadaceae bacterium]MDH7497319.1 VWA domain-containing protein [Syntrophomonadaceae bacterium]
MTVSGKNEAFDTSTLVGNYLGMYFDKEQGVRLGETTVVSRKAHALIPGKKGHVRVLTNRDAGKTYRNFVDVDQVVHIDVHHSPGEIDPRLVARHIYWGIEQHLVEIDPSLGFNEEEKNKAVLEYALRIEVVTAAGKGTVYDLSQGEVRPPDESERHATHIHILASFTSDRYLMILPVAQAAEEAILEAGLSLGKIKRIVHGKEKAKQESLAGYLILPWRKSQGDYTSVLMRENQNQLILKLAEKFASVEELEEFMESYSSNIFKRKSREEQKRKVGDLDEYLEQLQDLGLMRKGLLGPTLTNEGKQLVQYMIRHRCDIEAEIRRSIRRTPGRSRSYQRIGKSERSASHIEFTNRNKTRPLGASHWSGDIAVPETIIQARKRGLVTGDSRLTIRKEDLQVYDRKSYVPIDICLLIDASASMAGDKRHAACYLAEHLLLTGREKVGVVIFQDTKARVVVPFTRNHKYLSRGLASIRPGGFTPMADGIATAVKLITTTKVSNPLLLMITDGVPNFPLWSMDAKADAMKAAEAIARSNIRFVCIGIESNKIFLRDLVEVGKGTLYVVDDLNQNCLIDIAKYERRMASHE